VGRIKLPKQLKAFEPGTERSGFFIGTTEMINREKKRKRISTQIAMLEEMLKRSLSSKSNGVPEMSIGAITQRLSQLRKDFEV
jgi:hypothetical protein